MARWIGLSLLVWIAGCGSAPAQGACTEETSGGESTSDRPIEEDIRELLVLTNAVSTTQQMMQPMVTALAQAYPTVPATLWAELMSAIGDEEFAGMLIDIYKRHYTREEITVMLRFYRSDVGRRIVSKMPAVIAEGQQAGAVWGQHIAERLLEGARSRGYEL